MSASGRDAKSERRRYWAINGRFLAQPMTGVQRHAHEIVRALDDLLAEGSPLTRNLEMELLVPPDAAGMIPLRSIRTRSVGRFGGHLWEQLVLPSCVRGGLLSLGNTGPLAAARGIVCIHDLNTLTFPRSYSQRFRLLYRALLPTLGRTSGVIATVSQYSAGELARRNICRPDKIIVAPNGHEHALRWRPQHSAVSRSAAGRDTIVLLGSLAKHKNSRLIVEMAGRLAAAGLRLAIVGISDAKVFNSGAFAPREDNIAWLGRLSDEEVAALLGDCLCLAFPSFAEGFGLPPLEAMALGCPVVVSDRTSLPEVCADAALYATPDNADAWFDRFVALHRSPGLRQRMIEGGRKRAAQFCWRSSAEQYLHAMARLDGIETAPSRPTALVEIPS